MMIQSSKASQLRLLASQVISKNQKATCHRKRKVTLGFSLRTDFGKRQNPTSPRLLCQAALRVQLLSKYTILIHSFIQAISRAPFQVNYYSETLPTQNG